MQRIIATTSIDFALGQAMKKMLEARRHGTLAAKRDELLGAIVYTAGAIVALEEAAAAPDKQVREDTEEKVP